MSHEEAAQTVFQIEAKNKGWDTEGGEAPGEQDRQEEEGENGPEEQVAPSHLKLDPIQEKLLKASQQTAAPLAVQQAQAMEGKAGQAGQPGPQQHAAPRNSAAFRRQTVRKENRYIGIFIFVFSNVCRLVCWVHRQTAAAGRTRSGPALRSGSGRGGRPTDL